MSVQSTQSLHVFRVAAASRHVALVVLAGAAVFASVAHARAGEAMTRQQPGIRVSYEDLNLARSTDTAQLYTRLRHAADAVCGDYNIRDLRAMQIHAACSTQALSDAVARVNDAELTALHMGDKRIRLAQRK